MESNIFYTHNGDYMGVYVIGEGVVLCPVYMNIIYNPSLKLIIADNEAINLSGDCFFYTSIEDVRFFERNKTLFVLLKQSLYSINTTGIDISISDVDHSFEETFLYYSSLIVDAEGEKLYYKVHNDSYIIYEPLFGFHIVFDYEGRKIEYKTHKDRSCLLIERSYIYDIESNRLYDPNYPYYNYVINDEEWE